MAIGDMELNRGSSCGIGMNPEMASSYSLGQELIWFLVSVKTIQLIMIQAAMDTSLPSVVTRPSDIDIDLECSGTTDPDMALRSSFGSDNTMATK